MNKEEIGIISGAIILLADIPYTIGVWKRKITINRTSWSLWSLLNLTVFITYWSSGSGYNSIAPFVVFLTTTTITAIGVIRKKSNWEWDELELVSIVCCWIALGLWCYFTVTKIHSNVALYLSIFAEFIAAILTLKKNWIEPLEDRPMAWIMISIGFGVSIFAIPNYSVTSLLVPIYGFAQCLAIALPLVIYRIKNKVPLNQWI